MPSVADLVEQLAVLLRAERRERAAAWELVPAQLEALRFLGRANRYSRQPGAVAEWMGSTAGTVSQTLSALERKGLIEKLADPTDQRKVVCRPTERGRECLLAVDGPTPLPDDEATRELLRSWLGALQAAQGRRTFGVCRTCRFFRARGDGGQCGLTGEPLSPIDAGELCREHEPAERGSGSARGRAPKPAAE
jgi:DNA-binding MarR family transcriptional regulator